MIQKDEILSMYREIVDYSGSFGDPIETPNFNPWQVANYDELTEFERKGVCVSMLCYMMTAIDNSTIENAVVSDIGRDARRVFRSGMVDEFPIVTNALASFFSSEGDFVAALDIIYHEWIVPAV